MFNSLNHLWMVAGSGIHSRQRQLDLISHNVANASTTGFKASQAGFQALIRERVLTEEDAALYLNAAAGDVVQDGMGTLLTHTTRLFTQGALQQTNDSYHLAINGEGFFQVANREGTLLFSRAGDFFRDVEGQIVNAEGYLLQPAVIVPEEILDVYIDASGRILGRADGEADVAELGAIQLALFANPDGLESVGNNAYAASAASGPALLDAPGEGGRGALASGFLEGSNVDLPREMTDLLRSQRAYSMSLRSLHVADELFRLANELPRA